MDRGTPLLLIATLLLWQHHSHHSVVEGFPIITPTMNHEPQQYTDMPYTVTGVEDTATTSPPPVNCKCTPNQCHDETGTCFSASGFCFTSLHKDTNGEFVVLKQGCLNQNKIGLAYMKSTLCPNDPLFVGELCNVDYLDTTIFPPTSDHVSTTITPPAGEIGVDEEGVTDGVNPRREDRWKGGESRNNTPTYPLYIVGGIVFLVAMAMGTMLLARFCRSHTHNKNKPSPPPVISSFATQGWQPVPGQEMTSSCSSGSGNTRLTERTLIREITFVERIGKGSSADLVLTHSWEHLVENGNLGRYNDGNSTNYQHTNNHSISPYPGADQKDCVTSMEYYLVLSYHPQGSLFDFLQTNTVTQEVGNHGNHTPSGNHGNQYGVLPCS
eukprot:sb/3465636/